MTIDQRETLVRRPAWLEIIIGVATLAVVGYGGTSLLLDIPGLTPGVAGVIAGVMSGAAAFAAFALAAAVRVRQWDVFGVRRTTPKWLLLGVAGGVIALIAKLILVPLFIALTNAPTDTQADYAASSQGGPLLLVLSIFALVVLTPIGEEFLFRGVIFTGLARYAPWVATLGSAAIFAIMHGINVVLPAAFIVGILAAELRRRSGSVWPGVVVHAVNNLIGVAAYALLPS
ncbi:type II CAAX endopeptidase family protein [Saxibacter everestensis]|uniref:Type II CAAX endopeptidase family protein n=1 Tax=Saxibacter everestensis TaxID=2909229 RepID=A0ABY8QQS3_9MICO|nr:type II CAAX endopeptidase family protein [Brevibacteriaceae bacterium ZFBP1038]